MTTQLTEDIKIVNNKEFAAASTKVEEQIKKESVANMEIKKEVDNQSNTLKARLAARKQQLALKKSGFID